MKVNRSSRAHSLIDTTAFKIYVCFNEITIDLLIKVRLRVQDYSYLCLAAAVVIRTALV